MQTTTHINPSHTELGEQFTQLEPDSLTIEEGDLLYALVRMRKPKLAIETGTGHGMATKRIGEALRANENAGFLITCDTDLCYVRDAPTKGLPVGVRCCTGLAVLQGLRKGEADFIFVDAGNVDNRTEELKLIIENGLLSKNGTLVIHDARNQKYKRLVEYVKSYGWPGLVLDSLAGIGVFQKP